MVSAFYLLLVIGHIGVFDVIYFHYYRCALHTRPECHREQFWHLVRHIIYGLQFLIIANLRFHGAALLFLVALYGADVVFRTGSALVSSTLAVYPYRESGSSYLCRRWERVSDKATRLGKSGRFHAGFTLS